MAGEVVVMSPAEYWLKWASFGVAFVLAFNVVFWTCAWTLGPKLVARGVDLWCRTPMK